MKNSSGILKGIIIFLVLVAIGITFGWLASRHTPRPPAATTVESTGDLNQRTALPSLGLKPVTVTTNEVEITTKTEGMEEPSSPEDQIGDILGDDTEITNKVEALLALYPKLSPQGKLDCAEHLSNLIAGDEPEEYGPLEKIILSEDVPPKVATHLLNDLINRDSELMMNVYLKVVCDPNHPANKEARQTLETYVDEDFGSDTNKWIKAVNDWLKENVHHTATLPAIPDQPNQ